MPTYEYECGKCGLKFERRRPITAPPLAECPECRGEVRQVISGGSGFIVKNSGHARAGEDREACSMERTGTTCCGREERCGRPPCGGTP